MDVELLIGIVITTIFLFLLIRSRTAGQQRHSDSESAAEFATKLNQDMKRLIMDLRESNGDSEELRELERKIDDLILSKPPE